jgi:hypothetical protein
MLRFKVIVIAAVFSAVCDLFALGPHEIVLLVNANSPDSREIANHYAKLRGVPVENMILLDVPADFGGVQSTISTQQFSQLIRAPVTNAIATRKIGDHVLAWVYSAGFPVAVDYPVKVSLHGMTLLQGNLPPAEVIDKSQYVSRMFRGPLGPGEARGNSLSLEQFAMILATNMTVPAMTIGHVVPHGLSVPEILDSLRFAVRADCSHPDGAVNFVMREDVRSTCRAWEIPEVTGELARLGVNTVVSSNAPDRKHGLIGLQVGTADTGPYLGVRLQAGSMAEHLTSFGAVFNNGSQSDIMPWIKAGASGTSGTVSEPYSYWTKFPHARFFVHYASGCTMLESFMESLVCPLQLYLLGDPLVRPYGTARPVSLICLADDDSAISTTAEFLVAEPNGIAPRDMTFIYLLDGRVTMEPGTGTRAKISVAKLDDGWHELRAVGYSGGSVRQQTFATKFFGVRNRDRSVKVKSSIASRVDAATPVEMTLETAGEPERIDITAQGTVIASGTNTTLKVSFGSAGPGPVRIQAVAQYAGGGIARSRPQMIEIKPAAP